MNKTRDPPPVYTLLGYLSIFAILVLVALAYWQLRVLDGEARHQPIEGIYRKVGRLVDQYIRSVWVDNQANSPILA